MFSCGCKHSQIDRCTLNRYPFSSSREREREKKRKKRKERKKEKKKERKKEGKNLNDMMFPNLESVTLFGQKRVKLLGFLVNSEKGLTASSHLPVSLSVCMHQLGSRLSDLHRI